MKKDKSDNVYICSHEGDSDDYWVLPHKNGITVSRIVTHLSEEVFRGTEWHVEVVISLDMIDGNIRWLFSSDEDYYDFFILKHAPSNIIVTKDSNSDIID